MHAFAVIGLSRSATAIFAKVAYVKSSRTVAAWKPRQRPERYATAQQPVFRRQRPEYSQPVQQSVSGRRPTEAHQADLQLEDSTASTAHSRARGQGAATSKGPHREKPTSSLDTRHVARIRATRAAEQRGDNSASSRGDLDKTAPHAGSSSSREAQGARPLSTPEQPRFDEVADSPTFVPRNRRISDGMWGAADEQLMAAARSPSAKVDKTVLLGQTVEQLSSLVRELDHPAYRGKQLHDWLMRGARTWDDFNNVPKSLRQRLCDKGYHVGRAPLHTSVGALDGTRKFLLRLSDNRLVETVGIPMDQQHALTACVSSQVGCPMRCTFCATGKGGFARNLQPSEILEQVLTVQEHFGRRVSNIVFMGMGEPLLNLPAVLSAYDMLTKWLGIGARSITLSTVGVPNAIRRLAARDLRCTLAVSLHAPTQELRELLVPSARAYPLAALLDDCAAYFSMTGRRVTYEYTLLGGMNDSDQQARQLATLLRERVHAAHVNVIPWNPVEESSFSRPSNNRVREFVRQLEGQGVSASVRVTRGLEAAAACGQLRNDFQKQPLPSLPEAPPVAQQALPFPAPS